MSSAACVTGSNPSETRGVQLQCSYGVATSVEWSTSCFARHPGLRFRCASQACFFDFAITLADMRVGALQYGQYTARRTTGSQETLGCRDSSTSSSPTTHAAHDSLGILTAPKHTASTRIAMSPLLGGPSCSLQ